MKFYTYLGFLATISFFLINSGKLNAQQPNLDPPNLSPCPGVGTFIPSPPLSQTQLSIPSLWLAIRQSNNKLIYQWFVDPDLPWVTLVVNRQIWTLSDYFQRYQFLNKFGTIAGQYGYNTRVCNRQGAIVAEYMCNFNAAPVTCQVKLDAFGFTNKTKSF
jgi:hypothetical protein